MPVSSRSRGVDLALSSILVLVAYLPRALAVRWQTLTRVFRMCQALPRVLGICATHNLFPVSNGTGSLRKPWPSGGPARTAAGMPSGRSRTPPKVLTARTTIRATARATARMAARTEPPQV